MEITWRQIIVFGGIPIWLASLFLQAWLSRKKSPRPGIALPGIIFLASIVLAVLDGDVISGAEWLEALLPWNIPTLVYMLIFLLCHKGRKERARDILQEREKLDIQNLE